MVVVAGGSAAGTESDAEVIDLCSTRCSRALPLLPYDNGAGVSLRAFGTGNPLFCGGVTNRTACHEYDPLLDEWVVGIMTLGLRTKTPTVELGNGTFWLMGSESSFDYNTTEKYEDGECSRTLLWQNCTFISVENMQSKYTAFTQEILSLAPVCQWPIQNGIIMPVLPRSAMKSHSMPMKMGMNILNKKLAL